LPNLKKGEQQPFLLFELNLLRFDKKSGIAFIVTDKNNSAESFGKMGGAGKITFFQKGVFPATPLGKSLF